MKIIKSLIALIFISSVNFLSAQSSSDKTKGKDENPEKAFDEGKMVLTVGYGFPNIYKAIFKAANSNSSTNGAYGSSSNVVSDIKGLGPAFLKFEYGLNKVVAVGASFGYYNFTLTQTQTYQSYLGSSSNYVSYTDVYKWYYTSFSAGARINFHFGTGKKLDPYAGVAAGYSANKYTESYSTTDPNSSLPPTQTYNGLIPVYFSITAGLRYYITDNVGFYAELGIDKWSVIQGGLSFKF